MVIAQLIQSIGLLSVLWLVLKTQLRDLPFIPKIWKVTLLKEMFGYGVIFQIDSIMSMIFDPMVKGLISKFGGLDALGYYGMANNLILQVRAFIVELSRVIVPAVATFEEKYSSKIKELFTTSYRITYFVSLILYGLLGISLPLICKLWLGEYQPLFLQFSLILIFAWFINTLIGPAYFSNLGSGKLVDNLISDTLMNLVSMLTGISLGIKFGVTGVVIGTGIGLIVGSAYLLFSFINKEDFKLITFIIPEDLKLDDYSYHFSYCISKHWWRLSF